MRRARTDGRDEGAAPVLIAVFILVGAFIVSTYPIWSYEFNEIYGGPFFPETGQGERLFGPHSYSVSSNEIENNTKTPLTLPTSGGSLFNIAIIMLSFLAVFLFIRHERRHANDKKR